MAYKMITGSTVIAMTKNYNSEAVEYEKEKDKAKKKTLKASLDLRAGKIHGLLMTDIEAYDKNASERYLNIDNRLTRAVNLIKEGKAALATYAKSGKIQDLFTVNVLTAQFQHLDVEETQDDKEYKAAQFAYRNNPVDFAHIQTISGEKFVKPALKIRQGTIDENKKNIQPKLEKIEQLAKMAAQLVTESELVQKGNKADLQDIRKHLADLLQKAKEHVVKEDKGFLFNMGRQVTKNVESMVKQVELPKVTAETVNMVEALQSNVIGLVKSGKVIVQGLKEQEKDAKASIPPAVQKDGDVSKALTELEHEVKAAEKILDDMMTKLKESMGLLVAAKKKAK